MDWTGVSLNGAQNQSIYSGKQLTIIAAVIQPNQFYWTNQKFTQIEAQGDDGFDDDGVGVILSDTKKSYDAVIFRLSTSFSFSGEEYHRFHAQNPIPPLLHTPYFQSVAHVDLTVSCESPTVIYIDTECTGLTPDDLVCFPLDKARRQYIAHRKSDVKSTQESVCHDKEETDYTYHVSGWCRNIVTNVQPAVVQRSLQHLQSRDEDGAILSEAVPSYKHQTSRTKSSLRKVYVQARSTRRNARPVMKSKRSKRTKGKELVMYRNKSPVRPVFKAGEAKHNKRRVAVCEETQSRSSQSLNFATELSAYNVLRKHAQQHSLQVLCLPTRDIAGDRFVSSARRSSSHGSSYKEGNGSPLQNDVVSVRHRVRLEYARNHPSATTNSHGTSGNAMASGVPTSTLRNADHGRTEIHFTRLPFDSKEITQLLHASDYSKIVQQVGTAPSTLQADALIPSLFIVGVAYFKMSRHNEAKEHFKKCEAAAKGANRDGDVMLCNAYLGDIEYSSQRYTQAAQYYKTAIAHHATGSVAVMFKLTPPTLSAIHAKLASSYRNASMMVQAIQHYKTAIDVAKVDRDCLSAHTSLGNLYQSVGDNSSALEEYKKSIELAEKLSDHVSLGWAHGNIGNAYLGLNKKDEAVYHLQKSLDLAVEYETTPQAIGRTYNNLGTAYQSMSNLDKAEEYYDLALSQAVYGNDIPGQARVYGNIGNVHMLCKNYERAIPHYSEVLYLSTDPPTISTARHNRGCAYYEWATFLQPKKPLWNANKQEFQCTFHGPHCDIDDCLRDLPLRAKELYRKGCEDLKKVVEFHEERLQHIKGSPKGLTLSVSLFESNSRTFHRLQDCLVNLHRYEEALVVAEQSRARTLGELLLKRKGGQVMNSLISPLSLDAILSILKTLDCPVVYFSYTGARLICWLFLPHSSDVSMNAFEIPLADDQFNGKSFDYLLRYSLTESLVERSFEMYQAIKYDAESSSEVQALYRLVGEPTLKILQKHINGSKTQKVTTISDSYTSLLPLTCLFDSQFNSFLGDHYSFNQIPSLLTMGVINQFPGIKVDLGEDSRDFCILGDPNIPPFYHNGELWNLGRLPHARKEAEWVAHALQTTPVLGDQAMKSSLLIRLMNAKVVHIATHGSASAGFLAFSSFAVHANEGLAGRNQVHGSNVLLYPEEVEKLTISPALVVLSSCDSGRGVVKADGIQGMARAFILAGAQSVLTTLWKIPDESASVFMQFFYQYLLDEMKSTLALQKAILSVRCFAKYSQYIHWSGYQLTGRDIQFLSQPSLSSTILKQRLGEPSVFPRLASIKKLENALVNSPCLPTDVQIVKGCPGVDPAEVVVDFISSYYKKFAGGIFWINCAVPELMSSAIKCAEKVIGTDISKSPLSEVHQALVVLDSMTQLPESDHLVQFLKNSHIHMIVISKRSEPPNKLVKEVDRQLLRGCTVHNVEPLTMIHSTQRMVHTLLKQLEVTPSNADQEMFEKLAEFTTGSPVIVEIASQVVLSCYDHLHREAVSQLNQMLSFEQEDIPSSSSSPTTEGSHEYMDVYQTGSLYDSWDSIIKLLDECDLSPEERLLLNCVSIFSCSPVPFALVTKMSSMIAQINHRTHLAGSLHQKLMKYKLLKCYPLPVVLHSTILKSGMSSQVLEFVHVPQQISRCLWNSMEDVDKIVVLSVAFSSVSRLHQHSVDSDVSGVCSLLHELFEENYSLVGEQCYQQMYSLYLRCK